MAKLHYHPDGRILITDDVLEYKDTPENLFLDSGETVSLPEYFDEIRYIQGEGLFHCTRHTKDYVTDHWDQYDALITTIATIIDAKVDRLSILTLDQKRAFAIQAIRKERNTRIEILIPSLDSVDEIQLIAAFWNMLDETQATPAQISAKDTWQYATTKINQAKTATEAQLDAYDPTTDSGWPT